MKKSLIAASLTLALGLSVSGCATKDYVHEYVQSQLKPVNERLDGLDRRADAAEGGLKGKDAQLATLGGRLSGVEATVAEHGERLEKLSKTAQEALDRASAAGRLAEGRLLYETVMSDDTFKFTLAKADLSDAAKAALDDFAGRVKAEGKPVFIEIQGHTDGTGPEAFNLALGQQRAEAVRRYLYIKHGLPLARMAAISYGESTPIADNATRKGRQLNRRVVLVVLR
jgi:outer membrane protein OmpA-like peptidoglycan-associated protein